MGGRHDRLLLPKTIAEKFAYGGARGRALPLCAFITATPVATKEALKLFQSFVALFFSKTDVVRILESVVINFLLKISSIFLVVASASLVIPCIAVCTFPSVAGEAGPREIGEALRSLV